MADGARRVGHGADDARLVSPGLEQQLGVGARRDGDHQGAGLGEAASSGASSFRICGLNATTQTDDFLAFTCDGASPK